MSTALGLYLFRSWPFPVENDLLQMVLLQKPYLFYGIKYGFVAMLFSTPYIPGVWLNFILTKSAMKPEKYPVRFTDPPASREPSLHSRLKFR